LHSRRRSLLLLLLLLLLKAALLCSTACSGPEQPSQEGEAQSHIQRGPVGMVYDLGWRVAH
jgi:hypothetical protein